MDSPLNPYTPGWALFGVVHGLGPGLAIVLLSGSLRFGQVRFEELAAQFHQFGFQRGSVRFGSNGSTSIAGSVRSVRFGLSFRFRRSPVKGLRPAADVSKYSNFSNGGRFDESFFGDNLSPLKCHV